MQATRFRSRMAAAAERRRDEALIRHGFVHRFLVAMQETCVAKRASLVAQLAAEQDAALTGLREKAKAEAKGRIDRSVAPVAARQQDERLALRKACRAIQPRRRPIRFTTNTRHHR